jgi:hypothetical protein
MSLTDLNPTVNYGQADTVHPTCKKWNIVVLKLQVWNWTDRESEIRSAFNRSEITHTLSYVSTRMLATTFSKYCIVGRHDYDYSGEMLVIVDDAIILDALMFMVWLSRTPMQVRL